MIANDGPLDDGMYDMLEDVFLRLDESETEDDLNFKLLFGWSRSYKILQTFEWVRMQIIARVHKHVQVVFYCKIVAHKGVHPNEQ